MSEDPPTKKIKLAMEEAGCSSKVNMETGHALVTHSDAKGALREFKIEIEVDQLSSVEFHDGSLPGTSDGRPQTVNEAMEEEDLPEDGFGDVPEFTAVFRKELYLKAQKMMFEDVCDSEDLPPGWHRVMHQSGMPVYVQLSSRVCSLSKPYFIGLANSETHAIPLSAIPYLAYQAASENTKTIYRQDNKFQDEKRDYFSIFKRADGRKAVKIPIGKGKPVSDHSAGEITASYNDHNDDAKDIRVLIDLLPKARYIAKDQLVDYCRNLFNLNPAEIITFKLWTERRAYDKIRGFLFKSALAERSQLRANIEDGVKFNLQENNKNLKKYPFLLFEYVRTTYRKHEYQYKQIDNADLPYVASVFVSGRLVSLASGFNKKHARALAARAALYSLMPEVKVTNSPKFTEIEPAKIRELTEIEGATPKINGGSVTMKVEPVEIEEFNELDKIAVEVKEGFIEVEEAPADINMKATVELKEEPQIEDINSNIAEKIGEEALEIEEELFETKEVAETEVFSEDEENNNVPGFTVPKV